MSAAKWVHDWVVRRIISENYDDAVQTLEMSARIKIDAEIADINLDTFLEGIAPTTMEQYLEDMLDDAANIEDHNLVS